MPLTYEIVMLSGVAALINGTCNSNAATDNGGGGDVTVTPVLLRILRDEYRVVST
jgi:hypothetical protein